MPDKDEAKWHRWTSCFDAAQKEVVTLFHTRWMWRTMREMMNSSGIDQYVVVQDYFLRTYIGTMAIGIRREVDADTRTTSLARCLIMLSECPRSVTRARFEQEIERTVDGEYQEEAKASFDGFAKPGAPAVDQEVVKRDLDLIRAAAAPVLPYTNQVIAHRQRTKTDVEFDSLTLLDFNNALDAIGAVTKKYYRLRHPGMALGALTPIVDPSFYKMFCSPWYTDAFSPLREWDQE